MSGAYDAVVLAGGTGSRLGGLDKPGLVVAGRSLLDRVLDAAGPAASLVVVGPARPTGRAVVWCREEPAYGGPVAALAAALPLGRAGTVAVLAADLPVLGAAVARLVAAVEDGDGDGALLVDAGGRRQPLTAAYHRPALEAALAGVGPVHGASMRRLLGGMRLRELVDEDGAALDVDTPGDVERAEARLRGDGDAAG